MRNQRHSVGFIRNISIEIRPPKNLRLFFCELSFHTDRSLRKPLESNDVCPTTSLFSPSSFSANVSCIDRDTYVLSNMNKTQPPIRKHIFLQNLKKIKERKKNS